MRRHSVTLFSVSIMSNSTLEKRQIDDSTNEIYRAFQLQTQAVEEQMMCSLKSCPVCLQVNCTECTSKYIRYYDDNKNVDYKENLKKLVENENECQDWGLSTCAICWKSTCECGVDADCIDVADGSKFNCSDGWDKKHIISKGQQVSSDRYNETKCGVCNGAAYDIDDCYNCLGLD